MAYVFDPNGIQAAVEKARGDGNLAPDELVDSILSHLNGAYPGQIAMDKEWVFSVTGSAMLQMTMLHVSFSEYLLLESYPIPMSCFTGRFRTTVYEFIASGKEELFRDGELAATPLGPGDHMLMKPGEAGCVHVIEPMISVEYARGSIPSMFALPVVNTMFGTLDYKTLFKTMSISSKLMWKSMFGPGPGNER